MPNVFLSTCGQSQPFEILMTCAPGGGNNARTTKKTFKFCAQASQVT